MNLGDSLSVFLRHRHTTAALGLTAVTWTAADCAPTTEATRQVPRKPALWEEDSAGLAPTQDSQLYSFVCIYLYVYVAVAAAVRTSISLLV